MVIGYTLVLTYCWPSIWFRPHLMSSMERSLAFVGIGKRIEENQILEDVSGYCDESEILGILGASGSGKTTLLDALGGRNLLGVAGTVYLKGERLHRKHRRAIAYVPQESTFFPSPYLTVRDHLLFAAAMRFDSSKTTVKMREMEVDLMVQNLSLNKCIDSPCQLVSGGERRRCAIGCELLCPQPLLLLLDEATSGLDSAAATKLMKNIREVATSKRVPTLISIHSPSIEIFTSFDRVMFLAEGKMVYDGRPDGLMRYLNNLGFAPVPSMNSLANSADFMLSLLTAGGEDEEEEEHHAYTHSFANSRLDLPHSVQLNSLTPAEILIKAFDSTGAHLDEVMKARDAYVQARRKRRLHGRGQSKMRERRQTLDGAVPVTGLEGSGETKEESAQGLTTSASWSQSTPSAYPPSVVLGQVQELTDARRARHFETASPKEERQYSVTSDSELDDDRVSSSSYDDNGDGSSDKEDTITDVWTGDMYVTSFNAQFNALWARSSKQNQSVRFTWLNVGQTLILSLLIGAAWFNVPLTQERLQDLSGLLFFISTYIFFASTFSAVMEFLPERPTLKRERESKLYHLSAYFLSKCVATLPVRLVLTIILFTVSYTMAIYSYLQVKVYFTILAVLLLLALVGESVGMFIGTLTVSFDKALAITTIATLAILLLGGFYVKNLPIWLQWLKYTSPLRYGYAAVVQIHILWSPLMECNLGTTFAKGQECVEDPLTGDYYVPNNQIVVDYLELGDETILSNCLVLLLFLVAMRLVTYISLRYLKLNMGGRK